MRTLEPTTTTLPRYQVDILDRNGDITTQPGYPGTDDLATAKQLREAEEATLLRAGFGGHGGVRVRDRRAR